ncbi:hypothetical protein PMAYCL1PPCAC_27417, partial [Pristionchus mayeri]
TKGVLLGVAGALISGFALHLTVMILIPTVVWPDAFIGNTTECLIVVVITAILSITLRIFIPHVVENVEFRAPSPPSHLSVILRFISSALVCLITIAYCTYIIYFGQVQPGNKTPVFIVSALWLFSAFPMMFFMARALGGVYYEGSPVASQMDVGVEKNIQPIY